MTRMMAALVIVTALTASAAARPDTRNLSCARINGLVAESQTVVLSTGPQTFKRFVASRRYCDAWEWTRPFVVPSADTDRCTVRSICYDPPVPHNQ